METISNPTPFNVIAATTVGYSGRYTITSLPTGDIATGIERGTLNINVDFNRFSNVFTGQIFDNSGARSGTISTGSLTSQTRTGLPSIQVFSSMVFTGSGSLDGRIYSTLEGGFTGTNAPTGIYAHSTIKTAGMADQTTMTIIGEMQANAHNFNN